MEKIVVSSEKQEKLLNQIFKACDIFNGVLSTANYKHYIITTVFLKYISDIWKEQKEEYSKQYGDDEGRILRKLSRARFVLPDGASFYDLYEKRNESNIGELINNTIKLIVDANNKKLHNVFFEVDFNSDDKLGEQEERNRRLKLLLEEFYNIDLSPKNVAGDLVGDIYMKLITHFSSDSSKKSGEFYTPHKVSELVAKLCKPKIGSRICDPTCGSGGLLIESIKVVGDRNYSVYGMETNRSTWALCRMNMFLHDADSARIEWCNTLTSPALVENQHLMKFDNIVANPPFSLDKWGADEVQSDTYNRFWRGIPPKSKGDYAFISHMIESAVEKEGRVTVVVPHGVLFRGASEGRIREKLITDNLLDAVIGLPSNLFPTTSIPVAILIFDRSREKGGANEDRKDVLFIDASKDYLPNKKNNVLIDDNIDKILNTYEARKGVEKYSYLASYDELKENDFNLNIPRYVDTFEEEEEIDIKAVQQEIDTLEGELTEVRGKMANLLKEMI